MCICRLAGRTSTLSGPNRFSLCLSLTCAHHAASSPGLVRVNVVGVNDVAQAVVEVVTFAVDLLA